MANFLRRQRAGLAAIVAIVLVMVGLAMAHPGVPAAQVQFNDGGVWVTNQSLKLAGHLNYPSRTLDGGVRSDTATFDIAQRGNDVTLRDTGAKRIRTIDTAALTMNQGARADEALTLTTAGGTTAALDSAGGKVWVMSQADASSFTPDAAPSLDKVVGARVAVGVDGLAHVVLSDGTVKTWRSGSFADDGKIQGIADLSTAQVSAVGDQVVVWDEASSTVRTPKGTVALPAGEGVALQQVGPASERVLLAGPDAAYWAPIGGGQPTSVPAGASGKAIAPAVVGSCGYLAWTGSGRYVRDCADQASNRATTVERIKTLAQPVFRTNRDLIVLNDVTSGAVLMVNEAMREVNNWQTVQTQTQQQTKEDDTNTEQTEDTTPEQRKTTESKPNAVDDTFGVRPGRTVTLPVLRNDSDPDGDVLTATVRTQPTGATVSPVRGGEALAIAVPANATGTYRFTYVADDGRGGTAEANVTVTVYPEKVNKAPAPARRTVMTMEVGSEQSYSVLGDWLDPESDEVFLDHVEAPSGMSVRTRPDGVITVKDLGTGSVGVRDLKVFVSDGREVGASSMKVTMKAPGTTPPVANTDHVTALKGQPVVIEPLANDVSPSGATLRLASVQQAGPGQKVVPNYSDGTVMFSATTVGTSYVQYQVTDGPRSSNGYMRIDVREPQNAKPITGDDIAMLPAGGTIVTDPLRNDTDPSGGVLVLQTVTVDPTAGVAVEIVDHGLLRISSPVGISRPLSFTYTVANGAGAAKGKMTVLPVNAVAATEAPIAVADKAIVREGDIVTVSVLNNDYSPAGLPLTLDPLVQMQGDAGAGDAFVSGDKVRFRAKKPGTTRLAYTIRDSAGNFSSAEIVLTVNQLDAANSAPQPRPLTGRVLAGQKVTIPIPTDGVDPEGDSVLVAGLADAPAIGTAVVKPEGIEYTAPAGAAGTDTFTYTAADRFGASAKGTVRVGIAPQNSSNQAPIAVPDDVMTRPGRVLSVNPVTNDVDPDGDKLALVGGSVKPVDGATTTPATVNGDLIELTAPTHEATLRYYYETSDGRGGQAKGVLTVKVTPDAPLKAPVAKDDLITEAQLRGKKTLDVPVLANDFDPDGSVRRLKVSTSDPGVTASGDHLTVTPGEQRQVILYTITDEDQQSAKAAVVVPPAAQRAPYIDPEKVPVKVNAGQTLTLKLDDYVIVRPGHSPSLTYASTVKAGAGADTSNPVKDAHTLAYTSTPDFSGLGSVTFEVTDGANPDDPTGQRATLTIPIQVIASPTIKHQPVLTPSEVVAASGEPATVVSLADMASDEDPGDKAKLQFSLGPVSGGFTAKLSGSKLEVSAPVDAVPGTPGSAQITVTDGTTAPVNATLPLRATASTRPKISVSTITINDAKAGSPSSVDLTGSITNPFADQGKPVTMVGQPTVTSGQGTVTADGLKVTITPAAGFHGQMSVQYQLADATGNPSRYVTGRILVTVRDKPEPPSSVVAETHLSKTVTLTFRAGANNGAPITGFTAKWSGGQQQCPTTTCVINGLTNNQQYSFTVTATNAVGESAPSAASNTVRPDTRPNPPGTPSAQFGDQQATVSWPAATSDGSPVTSYTVQISPAAGGVTQKTVNGTSLVWTGLRNGTAYTFRVQAHSAAKDPSDWSGTSAAVTPVGLPGTPASPSVSMDPIDNTTPSGTVKWTAPNANGDPNLTYEVRQSGGSTVYSGTGTTTPVTMQVSSTDQTFQVRAKNKAGWSAWSSSSNAVRPAQMPGQVPSVTASATGQDSTIKLSFGTAAGNGALPGEITYYWSAGGVTQSVPAGGSTISNSGAFPNGQNVTVTVWAVSRVNGQSITGPKSSTTVKAYGPPTSPSMTCTSAGGAVINCSWSGGNANGQTTSFAVSGDWTASNGGASGSHSFTGLGYDTTKTLCVQAVQTGGATGTKNCDNAKTDPAPPPPPPPPPPVTTQPPNPPQTTDPPAPAPQPTVTLYKGAGVSKSDCSSASCAYIGVKTANFSGSVSCSVSWDVGNYPTKTSHEYSGSSYTLGANDSLTTGLYYGFPGWIVSATCNGVKGTMTW